MKKQILTAEVIEAFSGVYLSPKYDQPQPTPDFHRECWSRYCSFHPACATAAPRNHAKSTGLTHDFILANVCFGVEDYIILVGSSEEMAIEHLGDIASELSENEELIRDFKIKGFLQQQKTDIIVERTDGTQFRILARGAEQKIRGRKWNGKRPGLIVGDDLEDDEQVENKDRRKKFSRWFFRACKQALRDGGRIRIHGTILHVDSLLARLIKNRSWNSKCYKAHRAFSDFSGILWPEKFPESRLKAIRQEFIDEGDSAGYSQEYLNDPRDDDNAYLKKEYFLSMRHGDGDEIPDDYSTWKKYYVGADWAVSKEDAANKTALVVAGTDIDNMLNYVDVRAGRWEVDSTDPEAITVMGEIFSVQSRWSPEAWFVEDGVIWKAWWPTIRKEMIRRDVFINFVPIASTKDKAVRGKPYQKRMKAGGCRYDKEASWYPDFESELLDFSAVTEAIADDRFDAAALIARGLEDYSDVSEDDDMTEEEELVESEIYAYEAQRGRSRTTGY